MLGSIGRKTMLRGAPEIIAIAVELTACRSMPRFARFAVVETATCRQVSCKQGTAETEGGASSWPFEVMEPACAQSFMSIFATVSSAGDCAWAAFSV